MNSETKLLHLKSFVLSFLGLISLAQVIVPAGLFNTAAGNQMLNAFSTKLSTGIHFFKARSNGRHIAILWPSHSMNVASVALGSEKALGWQQGNSVAALAAANAVYVASNQEPYRADQYYFVSADVNNPRQHAFVGGGRGHDGVLPMVRRVQCVSHRNLA